MDVQNNLWSRVSIRSSKKASRRGNKIVFFIMKQIFDLLVSFLLLLLLLPLILIISILLYKNEGFPILSREIKAGKDGQPFTLYRFRTLTNRSMIIRALPPHPFPDNWEYGVPNTFIYQEAGHSIVTRTGRLLMRLKLDNLPKLINVLQGQMSFIGPEPERANIAAYYNDKQRKRLAIKPGIISYKHNEIDMKQGYESKVKADLYYINNCSCFLDINVAMRALLRLFK